MVDDDLCFTHKGVRFLIGPRTDGTPGIRWCIPIINRESVGAFYNGDVLHPEGALKWAETACRSYIDITMRRGRSTND